MINKTRYFLFHNSFTLVEILLVILLIGIVAGMVAPRFGGVYSNLQLKETAKNVAFLMRYAQNQSIVKKTTLKFIFDNQKTNYSIARKNESDEEGEYIRIRGRFGRTFQIPENVRVETEQDYLNFYPDGRMDKARIYFCNKNDFCYTVSTKEQAGYVYFFDFKLE